MTISYRPASSDDISAILEIENKTNQMPWTEAQFISSMEVGHFSVVLHEKNNIQGFAIYSPIVPESHLLNIAIDPAHQGKGLGDKGYGGKLGIEGSGPTPPEDLGAFKS